MEWVQVYNPMNSDWLSPLLAGAPIILLLGLLALGVSAPRAALAGLASALGVAVWVFGMPASSAVAAAGYGAAFGLLPIGWIVLSAVFLYHLTVRTGQFEVVKHSVAAISPDHRIQALLIAFSFGTFLEGAAGFGTPVAISAALLIGLGFKPLYAAGLALIANTSPVAFGALGTPILMLAKISEIDAFAISQMAGRQLPLFSLVIPAWMVVCMSGWKGLKGCWPAVLVCGGSFATVQYIVSNFYGPALVDVAGGVISLVVLAVFCHFWKPKEIWRFPKDKEEASAEAASALAADPPAAEAELAASPAGLASEEASQPLTAWRVTYAWMPWALLSLMIGLWGWPAWKTILNGGEADKPNLLAGVSKVSFEVPRLHQLIYRNTPVVHVPKGATHAADAETAVYELNWLSTTGTSIFLAAILSAVWLRVGPLVFFSQLLETLYCVRWALLTIACMLALAFATKYSGMDATLGLAFTRTGWFYPFFAPMLGWLGVALTGSDTSANALFGSLQKITAEQLGLNPLLIVTSNSTGGVMGKMIDAQSIVVAAVATKQSGHEGPILRFVFLHSVVLACLIGLLTILQAYVFPWMIPGG